MSGCIFAILLATVGQTPAGDQAPAVVPDDVVSAAIRDLGSDIFQAREKASRTLWLAGDAAVRALEAATQSDDAEVKLRATEVLQKLDRGISPNTPENDRRLIEEFWASTTATGQPRRVELAKQVGALLSLHPLVKSLRGEQDREVRFILVDSFDKAHPQARAELIRLFDPRLEELLEAQSIAKTGIRLNYIEYLLIMGRLDERTADDLTKVRQNPADTMLAARTSLMLRAKGDGRQALQMAPSDPAIRRDLAIEAGSWSEVPLSQLAPLPDGKFDPLSSRIENPFHVTVAGKGAGEGQAFATVENLAYQAAVRRLAGDRAGSLRSLDALVALADRREDQDWGVARALLLNDEIEKGIAVLERNQHAALLFMVRVAQGRRRDALKAIGFPSPCDDPGGWYRSFELPGKVKLTPGNRLGLSLDVAALLRETGNLKQAESLFDAIADSANGELLPFMSNLIHKELAMGLRDQAVTHAVLYGKRRDQRAMLGSILPESSQFWWAWWQKRSPDAPPEKALGELLRLMNPLPGEELPPEAFRTLAEGFAEFCQPMEKPQLAQCLLAIAGVARLHGHMDLTLENARRAVEVSPQTDNVFTLACHCMEAEHFEEAARWYQQCAERDPKLETYRYMQGEATVRAGNAETGKKLVTAASLAAFGNTRNRANLANNLQARGFRAAHLRQCEILLRTGELHSPGLTMAAVAVANSITFTEPARAADLYERDMFRLLAADSKTSFDSYLRLPNLIHKTRARALLANGNIDEALEHIRQAQLYLPQETRVVEEFVPKLEQGGHAREAAAVFDRAYGFHHEAIVDFPNDAWNHHALAWLLARVDRRLDEALAEAKQAVELSPGKAEYLDTLAEVLHRQQDAALAVETARKAAAAAPRQPYYQARLKRFEAVANHTEPIPPDPASPDNDAPHRE